MTDVLAALNQLEAGPTRRKGESAVEANTRRNASAGRRTPSHSRTRAPNSSQRAPSSHRRPASLPSQISIPPNTGTSRPSSAYTPSLRKISFASELPRPALQRLRIATKTDALPSGFPYDSRLFKYGVTAEEWNEFSGSIIEAADVPMITHVPVLSWTWAFHRGKVTKGVKRQMLYESSKLMRELKRWNKLFRRQGFQVALELPGQSGSGERSRGGPRDEMTGWETKEEKDAIRQVQGRFRMVITPNAEKGSASIYSRGSSLTRGVSGEGAATTGGKVPSLMVTDEEGNEGDDEGEGEGVETGEFGKWDFHREEEEGEDGMVSIGVDDPPAMNQGSSDDTTSASEAGKLAEKEKAKEEVPPVNTGIPLVVQQMLARAAAEKKAKGGY